nr:proline-rich protein 2-like [Taeniopygia guttata]
MRYRRKGARTELSRGLAPARATTAPNAPGARAGLRSRVPGVRCRALPWPRGPPGHRLLHRETFTAASRGRTDSPAPLRPRHPPGAGRDPPRPAGAVPRSREGPPCCTGPSAEPQPPRGPGQPSSAPLGPAAVPAPAEALPGRPGGRQVLVPAPPPPARPQRPPPRTGCSRRGGRGSRCCCCRCRRGSAAAVAYGSLPAGMPAHRWHNPRRGRAGRGQLLACRRCRGAGTAEAGGRRGGQAAAAAGEEERGRRRAPRRHCPCPAVARRAARIYPPAERAEPRAPAAPGAATSFPAPLRAPSALRAG